MILELAKEMIRLSGLEPDKDIPIVFTRPRPGEKLFEEILNAEEGSVATRHQKIFIAKLSPTDKNQLDISLKTLRELLDSSDREKIQKALQSIVPSYKER